MATRDPNFWKRFSVAVHQDDLAKAEMSEQGKNNKNNRELKHSPSWLVAQKRKARQRTWMCLVFWGVLLAVVGGVVGAVVVLRGRGAL